MNSDLVDKGSRESLRPHMDRKGKTERFTGKLTTAYGPQREDRKVHGQACAPIQTHVNSKITTVQ